MENDNIIIRKVEKSDFRNLVNLYNEVWPALPGEDPEEHYKMWESKANFVLNESTGVSYLAELDGRIVGSRTSFFMNAFYANQPLKCAQIGDSCVAKECRGRHLFLRLNEAFLNGFFNESAGDLVYNISVDASRKAYEKLGWVYIKSLRGFRKYVSPLKTLWRLRFNPKRLSGAPVWDRTTEVIPIDEALLEAREKELSKSDLIHIRYDASTFNWRMKSQNGIKIFSAPGVGCVVYKLGKKPFGTTVALIGEMFLYEYTFDATKALYKAFLKQIAPEIIIAEVSAGHPLAKIYPKLGFKASDTFANHGVKVVSERMKEIGLNPNCWAISFMDIDTF